MVRGHPVGRGGFRAGSRGIPRDRITPVLLPALSPAWLFPLVQRLVAPPTWPRPPGPAHLPIAGAFVYLAPGPLLATLEPSCVATLPLGNCSACLLLDRLESDAASRRFAKVTKPVIRAGCAPGIRDLRLRIRDPGSEPALACSYEDRLLVAPSTLTPPPPPLPSCSCRMPTARLPRCDPLRILTSLLRCFLSRVSIASEANRASVAKCSEHSK